MTSKTQRPKGQTGKSVSGQLGIPMHEAGLYDGRIEQLNPIRRQAQYSVPGDNHNMTNFTPVRLSEDETSEDDDAVLKGDTPLSEGIPGAEEDPNMQGYSDPMSPDALPHDLGDEMSRQKPGCGCGGKNTLRAAKKMLIPILEDAEPDEVPAQGPIIRRPTRITFSLDSNGLLDIETMEEHSQVVTAALNAKESAWWKSMSPTAKRSYLERHPNSKYGKAYRRAQLRKSAKKRNAGGSDPEVVPTNEDSAPEPATENTVTPPPIPAELDNEMDQELDNLNSAMDQALEETPDEEDEEEQPAPEIDHEAVENLQNATARPGFFTPVISAIKKRASKSTLGAMSRAVKGKMQEGDKEKVARGLTLMASAILVVGVSVGVGAIAGPGVMAQFASDYANHVFGAQSDGEGFDFFGTASSDDAKTKSPISDDDLTKLTQHFVKWMIEQTKKGQDE